MNARKHILMIVTSHDRSDDFEAVFFPGGHGTMYDLPVAKAVLKALGVTG